jgi:hypothetical protein
MRVLDLRFTILTPPLMNPCCFLLQLPVWVHLHFWVLSLGRMLVLSSSLSFFFWGSLSPFRFRWVFVLELSLVRFHQKHCERFNKEKIKMCFSFLDCTSKPNFEDHCICAYL